MNLKREKFHIFLLLILVLFSLSAVSQKDSSVAKKRILVSGLPVIFYTPETRLGFGATGLCLFNFKTDTLFAPRSSLSLSFVYTQNKQILLSLPFNLFIRNRLYLAYGEITFNRFNYNFYGVGNQVPVGFSERYGVEFPRLRLTLLKKLAPFIYGGLRYAYDNISIKTLDAGGILTTGNIRGAGGGVVHGLGLVGVFDRRDQVYFPSKGEWAELVLFEDIPALGASFKYTRIAFDFCKYLNYHENIIALNAYTLFSPDEMPFFQMGMLGGIKKMRGFYEGRYRDNNALILQAEYRRMFYGPIGFTFFASAGQVARQYSKFNYDYWKITYGVGLRLRVDEKQKLNLRFDLAVGNGAVLPYFTVGEAF